MHFKRKLRVAAAAFLGFLSLNLCPEQTYALAPKVGGFDENDRDPMFWECEQVVKLMGGDS